MGYSYVRAATDQHICQGHLLPFPPIKFWPPRTSLVQYIQVFWPPRPGFWRSVAITSKQIRPATQSRTSTHIHFLLLSSSSHVYLSAHFTRVFDPSRLNQLPDNCVQLRERCKHTYQPSNVASLDPTLRSPSCLFILSTWRPRLWLLL